MAINDSGQRGGGHQTSWGAAAGPVLLSLLVAALVVAACVIVLHAYGVLTIPTDDKEGKAATAAFALVGTFFTGAVTLVGTLLKYSIDRQTSERARIDADRNHQLAREAEARHSLESERNHALAIEMSGFY